MKQDSLERIIDSIIEQEIDCPIGCVPGKKNKDAYKPVNKKRKKDAAYKKLSNLRKIFGEARRIAYLRAKQGV